MTGHLERFIEAQNGVIETARQEIQNGRKTTHWIWFIFPQMRGLGASPTAEFFGMADLEEARAYLEHPVLGERLRACTNELLDVAGRSAEEIFGYPDWLKVQSCMTLFEQVAGPESVFAAVLEQFYNGERDERTLALLRG